MGAQTLIGSHLSGLFTSGKGGGDLGMWSEKVRMLGFLWLVVMSLNSVMAERGMSQMMKNNVEDYTLPLQYCDFHFKGHRTVPPIFNLQNPGQLSLSSNIITRDGKELSTAATGDHCRFPVGEGEETVEHSGAPLQEIAAICAEHFHMELDRLATTALMNVTEFLIKSVKGRHVLLPLTSVDMKDGTKLRIGDGDRRFPESRRCISFFTASDITTLLEKVLNKAHRKKFSKISVRAHRFRYDFNSLLNSILQFP